MEGLHANLAQLYFMTVLDQVLQAEKDSAAAVAVVRETAQRNIAEAEQAKNNAISNAKEAAQRNAAAARTQAEEQVTKEVEVIVSAAQTEAATVKKTISSKAEELAKYIVDAYKKHE